MGVIPLAPNGVFWSLQGEGHLRGTQMVFVRLAGCDINCAGCDTDYSVHERLEGVAILDRIAAVAPIGSESWVWITGGEPTIHDLRQLVRVLRTNHYRVALATAGHRRVDFDVDWLSVSPHDPARWVQTQGHELKLVAGLNGRQPWEFLAARPDDVTEFLHRFVQPVTDDDGTEDAGSLEECVRFLKDHPRWRLSRQDHVAWRLP